MVQKFSTEVRIKSYEPTNYEPLWARFVVRKFAPVRTSMEIKRYSEKPDKAPKYCILLMKDRNNGHQIADHKTIRQIHGQKSKGMERETIRNARPGF